MDTPSDRRDRSKSRSDRIPRDIERADVEACFAHRSGGLRFPEAIESEYQEYRGRFRASVVSSTVLPSLLIYNSFLILDYMLLPATFWLALLLHLEWSRR